MFEKLILKCIYRPIATTVAFGAIVVSGLFAAFHMPLEILPSVEFPKLYIQTAWPGASPPAVEAYITSLIEGEISTEEGIANIRSESSAGFSQIEVELLPDSDLKYLRFFLQEKLSLIRNDLPFTARPPRIIDYIPEEIETARFMSYQITGPLNDAKLRRLALKRILPVVNSIPGVAGAEVIGGRERQIQIQINLEKLRAYDITSFELQKILTEANLIKSIGSVLESRQKHLISIRQQLLTLHDIETLPVKVSDNRIIRMRDVATVLDTLSPARSLQRINGQSTILIQIKKQPQANTITVSDRIYRIINNLQGILPEKVQLIKEDDQSIIIRESLRQLLNRALFSFLLVFLVLILFLQNLRFAFVVQLSIIISALTTLLLMFIFKYSLNIITLAGLALGFGILVDNAVVVLENIYRKITIVHATFQNPQSDKAVKINEAIYSSATYEVALPLFASTLTTLAALIPFLYLLDELRIYYTPFAITVSLALLASLVVAFLLIPTITHQWTSKLRIPPSGGLAVSPITNNYHRGRFVILYQRILRKSLNRPWITILIVIWFFGLPVWLLPNTVDIAEEANPVKKVAARIYNNTLGSEFSQSIRPYVDHLLGGSLHLFFRYVDQGEIWRWGDATMVSSSIRLPDGTDIEETNKVILRMEEMIDGIDGIQEVRTRVFADFATLEVRFNADVENSIIPYLVKEKLIAQAARIGNARIHVSGYGLGFNSGDNGISFQNRFQVSGYNYNEINILENGLKNRLSTYPRVKDIQTNLTRRYYSGNAFESTVRLNHLSLAKNNLDVRYTLQQLNPFIAQYLYRQRLRLGNEEVPFSFVSHRYENFQLYQLQNLLIQNPFSQSIRLQSLSHLLHQRIQPVIERENQNYYKIISFEYLAPQRFTEEFVESFIQNSSIPPGFSLKEIQSWWQNKDTQSITYVLVLGLLLMYMVLAGLYESIIYPFLIFLIIPLSMIGVFIIYYLTDTVFNQAAYIGVIFLIGIVLNNGIIMLDRINQYKRDENPTSFVEFLITAGSERLRPVLITTTTTVGGLLPLLLLTDQNNPQNIWYTLSLSTIGGLIAATTLGLIVLPVLVLILKRINYKLKLIVHFNNSSDT